MTNSSLDYLLRESALEIQRRHHPECNFCHSALEDKCERVTEICVDCMASDPQAESEFNSAWESYMNERNETREHNS